MAGCFISTSLFRWLWCTTFVFFFLFSLDPVNAVGQFLGDDIALRKMSYMSQIVFPRSILAYEQVNIWKGDFLYDHVW